MSNLSHLLPALSQRALKLSNSSSKIGEQNTKAALISPILEALGWDIADPDEVCHEYRLKSTDNPVDYALLVSRTPRLFVEAKGLGENLDDPRWANQAIAYASVAGVQWVVLTDGVQWKLYNAAALVPAEQKLFRSVTIGEEEAHVLLGLLSKDEIVGDRLADLWQSENVDAQVRAALESLFSGAETDQKVVNLVRSLAPDLNSKQVRASLMRLRATFDFPAVEIDGLSPSAPSDKEQSSTKPAAKPDDTTHTGRLLRWPLAAQLQTSLLSQLPAGYVAEEQVITLKVSKGDTHKGDIAALKSGLKLILPMSVQRAEELAPALAGRFVDISQKGHWGVGDTSVNLSTTADLTPAVALLA